MALTKPHIDASDSEAVPTQEEQPMSAAERDGNPMPLVAGPPYIGLDGKPIILSLSLGSKVEGG